jgi:hypothetical protein
MWRGVASLTVRAGGAFPSAPGFRRCRLNGIYNDNVTVNLAIEGGGAFC